MAQDNLLIISTIILFLPLLGFTFLIFFGKRIGKPSSFIGSAILGIDLILALYVAYQKLVTFADIDYIQTKFNWIDFGRFDITVGIGIDNIAALMLVVVTLISFLVHVFSMEYMHGDKRFSRFYAYLGIFTFSMLGIVIANNFLFMYVFWELVGLSSYLLIGFWYEKDSAANASKKAFITNRIGDLGFFIGIAILFVSFGTVMFDEIFATIGNGNMPYDSGAMLTAAGILVFCGAIGKSAQFPLHVWLPDAMEGPTPVSALIHAATMVAAGVYLTARVFPMLTADALLFVAFIGAITAFMAATIAITQKDFKKVLAYSTVSQLGYMVMAIGVGAYTSGFFHLVTHAWFKACLFLVSGSVIHAMHVSMHKAHDHHTDPQSVDNMGGLRHTMPLTYITFLIATLAISGVPFTSGFLSKDGILAGTLAFAQLNGGLTWFIPIAGFGAAGITAFYMFRLMIVAFHGKPKSDIAVNTTENKGVITYPLILLAVISFWIFYSVNPLDPSKGWFHQATAAPASVVPAEFQRPELVPNVLGEETHSMAGADNHTESATEGHTETELNEDHGSEHHYINKFEEEMHHAHMPAMIASLLIAGFGIFLAFLIYQFKVFNSTDLAKSMGRLYYISYNKWYFDEIYEKTAIGGTILLSKLMAYFDRYVIDGIVNFMGWLFKLIGQFIGNFDNIVVDGLVNLIANIAGFIGAILRKFQTGRIQTYVAMAIIGIMVLVYFFI